jgi:hypothetical protein
MLGASTCGEDADLPGSWSGAGSISVDQSSCGGDPYQSSAGHLVLSRDMAILRGRYEGAPFRCNQHVCAYRRDEGMSTRILVQPCDMNPGMVTRCDCLYSVSFPLDGVVPGALVELYHRWDRAGSTGDPAPVLVDREQAP